MYSEIRPSAFRSACAFIPTCRHAARIFAAARGEVLVVPLPEVGTFAGDSGQCERSAKHVNTAKSSMPESQGERVDEAPSDDADPPSDRAGANAAVEAPASPTPGVKMAPEPQPDPNDPHAAQRIRDRRLVRRLKAGEERAFQELVLTYQDRIFGLVYRMLGNRQEAEDVAQEVFISVHRGIANYRGEGKLYTWMYRIASNTCKNRIKYLKGRNFHRASDIDDTPAAHLAGRDGGPVVSLQSQVPNPEAQVEGHRLESAIQRELNNLDPDHRLVIILRDVQGLSYQDIIRITGLNEGTLKSRLHRARLALKARLEGHLG